MAPQLTDRALPERIPGWGVLVLESHHSPRFQMEWRTHPFAKIVYVLQGEGTFHLGSEREAFETGDVIVVPPGIRNRIEDNPGSASSLYVCCIQRSVCRFDPSCFGLLETAVLSSDGHFANRVASLFRRLVHAQQRVAPTRAAAMVSDALKLIVVVSQRTAMQSRRPQEAADERARVQAYVDSLPDRFYEETLIDAACVELGIARRSFTRLFAEITGETWLQHLRRLAIEHARRRLTETDIPISSVAFECGFNDLSTFYRQFKKLTGVAPGQYRSSVDAVERRAGAQQD